MAKSHSIKYSQVPPQSSISDLIHTRLSNIIQPPYDPQNTSRAERARIDREIKDSLYGYFNPPKPFPIVGKGYPYLDVVYEKLHVWFTSTEEIDHFIDVYSQKVLPSARALAARYDKSNVNKVWISRVPKLKYPKRLEIAAYVSGCCAGFRKIATERQVIAAENLKQGMSVPKLGNSQHYSLRPPFDS